MAVIETIEGSGEVDLDLKGVGPLSGPAKFQLLLTDTGKGAFNLAVKRRLRPPTPVTIPLVDVTDARNSYGKLVIALGSQGRVRFLTPDAERLAERITEEIGRRSDERIVETPDEPISDGALSVSAMTVGYLNVLGDRMAGEAEVAVEMHHRLDGTEVPTLVFTMAEYGVMRESVSRSNIQEINRIADDEFVMKYGVQIAGLNRAAVVHLKGDEVPEIVRLLGFDDSDGR